MNKNNLFLRKTLLSVAIGVLLAMMVASSFASSVVIAQHATGFGYNKRVNALHPSTNASYSALSQTFTVAQAGYLQDVRLAVMDAYTGLQSFTVKITGIEHTYGSTGHPNATVYATSSQVDIPSSPSGWYTFYFDGTYLMENDTQYCLYVYCSAVAGQTWSGDAFGVTDTAYSGNYGYYSNSDWTADATYDMWFYVEGDTGSVTPAAPSPLATYDELINSLVSFIVPVTIVLLPALLLIMVTRRAEKWIILIGITIGVGLGYVLMPMTVPIWLVFLVVIGLIGMAYQSVRGGG